MNRLKKLQGKQTDGCATSESLSLDLVEPPSVCYFFGHSELKVNHISKHISEHFSRSRQVSFQSHVFSTIANVTIANVYVDTCDEINNKID